MKESIDKNRKKILDEEHRNEPSKKGYNFGEKNEEVLKLMKNKDQKRKADGVAKDKKIIKGFIIGFSLYFILFTTFTLLSLNGISKDLDNPYKNTPIAQKEQREVLYTATVEGVTIDIYEVERINAAMRVVYGVNNNSKTMVNPVIENTYLLDKEDNYYQGFMDFATLSNNTLYPGESYEGFMAFAVFEEDNTNKPIEEQTQIEMDPSSQSPYDEPETEDVDIEKEKEEKKFVETDMKMIFNFLNKENIYQIEVDFRG